MKYTYLVTGAFECGTSVCTVTVPHKINTVERFNSLARCVREATQHNDLAVTSFQLIEKKCGKVKTTK